MSAGIQRCRRRLPAFGRRLMAMRRAGLIPDRGQLVIAVADWKLANTKREDVLVVPPDEQPTSLDWHVVAGLHVQLVVNEHDIEVANEVAAEVIRAGCKGCAALIHPAFGKRIGWRLYQSHRGAPDVS